MKTEPDAGRPATTSSRRVAGNVLMSGLGRAWSALAIVITVPVIVHHIGVPAYGIFTLVNVLLGYVAFLDFGLTAAVVRSVAIHRGRGDDAALERSIGTALTALMGLGVAGGAVIFLVAPLLVTSVFHVPGQLEADGIFAFRVAAFGFACNLTLVVFSAISQGLQRLDVFASRTVLLGTANAVAQIAAVSLGGGLRWLALVTVALTVCSFAVFVLATRRLLPDTSIRPRLDGAAFRELAGFGSMRFLNQASAQAVFQLDPVIIGAFLPIASVAFYAVPLNVTQKLMVLEDSVASAFFPAAVDLHHRGETNRLRLLYLSALKLVLVVMLFLSLVAVGYSWAILAAWVGPNVANNSASIFAVLAVAYGLAAIIGIPASASDATGHQRWTAAFAMASAVINVGLSIVLVPRIGAIGPAWALLFNSCTQGLVFVWLVQHRFLRIPMLRVLGQAVARPAVAAMGLAIYLALTSPHVRSLVTLVAAVAGGLVLYLGLTLLLRVWAPNELDVARKLLHGAGSRVLRRFRPPDGAQSKSP
jgi:O-antigen/teichoic acid export membrane protein